MRIAVVVGSFVFLSLFSSSGLAQAAPLPAPIPQQEAVKVRSEQRNQEEQLESRRRETGRLDRLQKNPANIIRRGALPFAIKPNKEQRKLLLPSTNDLVKYAAFLEQPRTGLFKLFPDLGCEENARVIRVDNDCLNWIPTSAFYSFREKEHTRAFLSDILLKNNVFVSNSYLSQGILVALGDVPLENVSLAGDGMKFLIDYQPSPESGEALKQFNQITRGVKNGKYVYRNVLPAVENMTYGIRAIAYRARAYHTFQGRPFNILEGDKRIDLILAFRVVGKDADGAMTLLWKELDRKESPRLVFPKKEKKKENKPANNQG